MASNLDILNSDDSGVPDFLKSVSMARNKSTPVDAIVLPRIGVMPDAKEKAEHSMVKMFAKGLSMAEISEILSVTYSEVSDFLVSPAGTALLKQSVDSSDENAVRDILEGAKLDTILNLIKMRDHGENGNVRVTAGKELTSMLKDMGARKGLRGMTPDQAIEEGKKRLAKLESLLTNKEQ
jgi:hypothetical protein